MRRWTRERQRLRNTGPSVFTEYVQFVYCLVWLVQTASSSIRYIFSFRETSCPVMASHGKRVGPFGSNRTAWVMLDHCGGLVHLFRLEREEKSIILSDFRYIGIIIRRKYYLLVPIADHLRRTRPRSGQHCPHASSSVPDHFGVITGIIGDWTARLLLSAVAIIFAHLLHAAVLITSRTEAAHELHCEFFTGGWQHQHSMSLLWPDDGLASKSEFSQRGWHLWPMYSWINAEKRLYEEVQNIQRESNYTARSLRE